jgi:hypothetical protein
MDEALKRVAELSPERQDAVAHWLLDELEADRRWDEKLDATADKLDALAEEVLRDYQEGKTIEKAWDEL